MSIEIHPATVERFDDVATLLGPRDPRAPACWCLSYRLTSGEFRRADAADRPELVRELCARDVAPGVLAYVDGQVAGWCGLGPRQEMGRLRRSRTIPAVDDVPVWSIVCFVVRTGFRRQGVASALLDGAVDYATAQGATALESYPIDTDGDRVSAAFLFVGTTRMFERAGFTRVVQTDARSAGRPRWLMRRTIDTT